MQITQDIKYIGVDDKTIDLFESQYPVKNGVSYNSYVIFDKKIAIMDTVDKRKTEEWLKNLEDALAGKTPDYLIIEHLEPDHAGSISSLIEKYPSMQIVGNIKTFAMFNQFFNINIDDKKVVVKENDKLSLGSHELQFVFAPMVHWPEVMVTFDTYDQILFSADGFGKFGSLDTEEPWDDEARRYYINIVGKYGQPVQSLLKKASTLPIKIICPLHGPVLKENISHYISLYDTWSSYKSEEDGVLICFASIHGNTKDAAKEMEKELRNVGITNITSMDLSREDMSLAVSNAFKYSKMILACATYDGGLFPPMEEFLHHLVSKTYRERSVGLIENGSWAPLANKKMEEILSTMKNITIAPTRVTIKSTLNDSSLENMKKLALEMK